MKALVVVFHEKLQTLVQFYLEARYSIQVHTVKTQDHAIPELMNLKELDFIACDHTETAKKLSIYCSMKKRIIPIFCISSKTTKDPALEKTDSILWINPSSLIERLQCELENIFPELNDLSTEPRFVEIASELLILSSPLPGGVYTKLEDLKFDRLLKAGHDFTNKDVETLHKTHIQPLYIKQEDAKVFVLKNQLRLFGWPEKSSDPKIDAPQIQGAQKEPNQSQVKNLERDLSKGFEVAQIIGRRMGFTPEVQALTKKNVDVAIKIIRTIPSLSQFLVQITTNTDKYISSHSMLLAYVACALASQLEWRSNTTYQKLTLAALLHDITLENQELASIQTLNELQQKEKQFTQIELKEFREHPLKAAEIVRRFSEIPPDVDLIISQHHERPDSKGFPRSLTPTRISPLSTVFIVAHDWVTYLFQNNAVGNSGTIPDMNEYFQSRQEYFSSGNFRKVLLAGKLIRK